MLYLKILPIELFVLILERTPLKSYKVFSNNLVQTFLSMQQTPSDIYLYMTTSTSDILLVTQRGKVLN